MGLKKSLLRRTGVGRTWLKLREELKATAAFRDHVETTIDQVETKIHQVETKIDQVETKIHQVETKLEKKIDISTQALEMRIDNIYKSLLRQEKIAIESNWTQVDLEDIIALDCGGVTIRELRERIQAEHGLIEKSIIKQVALSRSPLQLTMDEADTESADILRCSYNPF